MKSKEILIGLAITVALTGCGGGGGGGGSPAASNAVPGSTTSQTPTASTTPKPLELASAFEIHSLDCHSGSCVLPISATRAVAGSQYHYRNETGQPQKVHVSGFPQDGLSWGAVLTSLPELAGSEQRVVPTTQLSSEEGPCVPLAYIKCEPSTDIELANLPLKSLKDWYIQSAEIHSVLEASQALPGGGAVYVWRDQTAQLTTEQANLVASQFTESIYPVETSLLGRPWGKVHKGNALRYLSPEMKDVNIVITSSLSPTVMGMVMPVNRTTKQLIDAGRRNQINERQLIFLSKTLFQEKDGQRWIDSPQVGKMLSTLAHEFTHLIFDYRKVAYPKSRITDLKWEDEFFAQATAHFAMTHRYQIAAENGARSHPSFPLRAFDKLMMDSDFSRWSTGSYEKASTLGAFMVHQYGPELLRDWLKSQHSGVYALNEAIRNNGGKDFLDTKARFVSTMLIASRFQAQDGYGFPSREMTLEAGETSLTPLQLNLPSLDMLKAGLPLFPLWKDDGSVETGQLINFPRNGSWDINLPANSVLILHKGNVPIPAL